MKELHCRTCFQHMSFTAGRCQRCGDVDPIGFRKSVTELLLGITAMLGAVAIVLFAFVSQCT